MRPRTVRFTATLGDFRGAVNGARVGAGRDSGPVRVQGVIASMTREADPLDRGMDLARPGGRSSDVAAVSSTRSFEAVYEAHYRDVYRYVLALVRDRDEADEVVAEAFEGAPTPAPTPVPPSPSPSAAAYVTDSADFITFEHPADWLRSQPNLHTPDESGPLIYLSIQPLLASCAVAPSAAPHPADSQGLACQWPLTQLAPDSVLVVRARRVGYDAHHGAASDVGLGHRDERRKRKHPDRAPRGLPGRGRGRDHRRLGPHARCVGDALEHHRLRLPARPRPRHLGGAGQPQARERVGGRLMAARRTLAAALITALAVSGCVGNHPAGAINLRNDSSAPVTVHIAWPGGLPFGLFGPSNVTLTVPPWQPGWCATAGLGVIGVPATVTVSGVHLSRTATYTVPADVVASSSFYMHVDRTGAITTGSRPPIQLPCNGYPVGQQP